MVPLGMVNSIHDSTSVEEIIQKTIEGIQRMISIHHDNDNQGEKKEVATKEAVIETSLAAKKH